MKDPFLPLYFESPPTQINTLISLPTTLWLTRRLWFAHFSNRAGTISSTTEAHEEEKEHVASALLNNGYPKWFIHRSASTRCARCDAVIGEPRATVCLPYISRTTKEDFAGVQLQDCDETTPDLKTEAGTSQECYPRHGEIRCNLLYPMCRMPSHLCWRN